MALRGVNDDGNERVEILQVDESEKVVDSCRNMLHNRLILKVFGTKLN